MNKESTNLQFKNGDGKASFKVRMNLKIFAIILLLLGLLYFPTVVFLDPYGVYNISGFNKRNFEPNTRFAKIEFLKKNKFEGYILGNSRVNGYSVKDASRLTGIPYYNLTADSEAPSGINKKIRWLVKNQPVKQVIFALDYGEFDQPINRKKNELSSQEHPEVSGESLLGFYWKYLWVPPYIQIINFYGNAIKKDTWFLFDVTTGHYYFPLFDKWMADDPEKYIKKRFKTRLGEKIIPINPEQLQQLSEAITTARRHGVDVKVFINPTNHRIFRRHNPQAYSDWLASIVRIAGSVWDFSGLNSVNTNDRFFYEESHFTFFLGNLALERVFDSKSPDLLEYTDFGILVTPENLDERTAKFFPRRPLSELSEKQPKNLAIHSEKFGKKD